MYYYRRVAVLIAYSYYNFGVWRRHIMYWRGRAARDPSWAVPVAMAVMEAGRLPKCTARSLRSTSSLRSQELEHGGPTQHAPGKRKTSELPFSAMWAYAAAAVLLVRASVDSTPQALTAPGQAGTKVAVLLSGALQTLDWCTESLRTNLVEAIRVMSRGRPAFPPSSGHLRRCDLELRRAAASRLTPQPLAQPAAPAQDQP